MKSYVHKLKFGISPNINIRRCLVKEDKDAVRNNLAGDANLVVEKIPKFPPCHPHFHPVHMLHKHFGSKSVPIFYRLLLMYC